MAATMASEWGALFMAYSLSGLSLWTMSGDMGGRYSGEALGRATGGGLSDHGLVRGTSPENRLGSGTSRAINERPFRLAEFLRSQPNNPIDSGASTEEARVRAGKVEQMRELRRRAAMALMVVALSESSNRKGG